MQDAVAGQRDDQSGGQRKERHVVRECPDQVLADRPQGGSGEANRLHDSAEIGLDQNHVGRFNGNIRAAAQGDSEIGLDQRGRVVDTVPDHGHRPSFEPELAHNVLGHVDEGEMSDGEQLSRNIKEVEAESVALLCCEALGLEGAEYCRGYIQSWLKGGTIPERSAQRIFAAADKILKAGQQGQERAISVDKGRD